MNLPRPDLLTEIALLQYVTFWCENGIGKILVVDVHCKYILLFWLWLRYFILPLGEISAYLKRWCQTKGLADPSFLEQSLESNKIQILLDWNRGSISRIHPKLDKEETSLGLECLAVSRDIELDSCSLDMLTFLLLAPDRADNVAHRLNVEPTSLLCFHSDSMPIIVESGVLAANGNKTVGLGGSLFLKLGEKILFEPGCHCLEENRSFHPNARENRSQTITYAFLSSLLPALKGLGISSEMV